MSLESIYLQHVDTLIARYRQVLDKTPYESILIHSGMPKTAFLDDNDYHFLPNPHFKHWVPLVAHPHSFILLTAEGKPRLIYSQPDDYWHLAPEDPAGFWVSAFDIVTVSSAEQARAALPDDLGNVIYIGEDAQRLSEWGIANVNPDAVLAELHYQRAYKTEYELYCMREANRLAALGHNAASDAFMGGGSEFDIHLAYLHASSIQECNLPYKNIVAVNEHGAVLHYHGCDTHKHKTDNLYSLVIDAGASFNGYAADITRSYSFREGEYAELVAAMNTHQLAIIDEISAGDSYKDLHWKMHHRIAEVLQQFGFVDMTPESIVETGVSNTFFPHGLGHFIGLQVHDAGGYLKSPSGELFDRDSKAPFLRLVRDIEVGQVFTIEPGLYFIDLLLNELKKGDFASAVNWQKVAAFKPYGGVRIEDCVAVKNDGVENLSRNAFSLLAK